MEKKNPNGVGTCCTLALSYAALCTYLHNSPGKGTLLWFLSVVESEAWIGNVTVCGSPGWEVLCVISFRCGDIGHLWVMFYGHLLLMDPGLFPVRREKGDLSSQCTLALPAVWTPLGVLEARPGPAFLLRGHGYSPLSFPSLGHPELGLISKYGWWLKLIARWLD